MPRSADACCAPCDFDGLGQVIAINAEAANQYMDELCEQANCDERCEATSAWYFTTSCDSNVCAFNDVRFDLRWSHCTSHADCQVRTPDCCECGASMAPGRLIAVSDVTGYRAHACRGSGSCDTCEVTYPDEVIPLCSYGRCIAADSRE